jgi:hypothetical protein
MSSVKADGILQSDFHLHRVRPRNGWGRIVPGAPMIEIRARYIGTGEPCDVRIYGIVNDDNENSGWFTYRPVHDNSGFMRCAEFSEFDNLHRYAKPRTLPGTVMK